MRDDDIRALERAASQGDATAGAQLLAAWIRAGRRLCGATRGTTWALLDAASGEVLRSYGKHRRAISGLAFSKDGALALTAGLDGKARLWDVALGRELAVLDARAGLTAGVLAPDATRAVTASLDRSVAVWDLATREVVLERRLHDRPVFALAVSPDGGTLLTGGGDGFLGLLDLVTGKVTLRRAHGAGIGAIAFSDDGARAATGSWDGGLRLWDVGRALPIRELQVGHSAAVEAIAFLPGGRIASAGRDRTIRIFDYARPNLLRTIEDTQRWVGSLALAPDGRTLLAGGERAIKLWDAETGAELRAFPGRWPDTSVAWLPVG